MNDYPVHCGGLSSDEFVVDLRCPDCGPRACDVVEYDRGPEGGVVRARCPGCGCDLWTNGAVPCDGMRPKQGSGDGRAPGPRGDEYASRENWGEDDGE